MVYKTRTYTIWCGIKQRCLNPKDKRYSSYGGRGIDVDPRWISSFYHFLEDMGHAPDGLSIDRIDNDKGYWKWNCKWSTDKEQKQNMRSTRFITANGKTMSQSEWARELGVHNTSILNRLKAGMTEEQAINTPFVKRNWGKSIALCLRCRFEWESKVVKPKMCVRCGQTANKKPHHVWSKGRKCDNGN
jgi:hypothetical protein